MKEKKKRRKTVEYGRYGYFFIAPFFITYLCLQVYPLFSTFYYSTLSYTKRNLKTTIIKPETLSAAFTNFAKILGITEGERAYFITYFQNTVAIWISNFIPQLLVALLLAVWLTDTKIKLKGTGIFKVIVYLPSVITAASISVLFHALFSQYGPITITLQKMGIISKTFDFMKSVVGSRGIIAFILFWMWYGNSTLLLISGILGINPSLFEAADIDGASGWKKFRFVTLPLLKPIMVYVLITSVIGGLQMYDIPALFNVEQSGYIGNPGDTTTTMTMYIMRLYEAGDLGRSSAVSVVLFFITLIISLIFFASMRDRSDKPKKSKIGGAK